MKVLLVKMVNCIFRGDLVCHDNKAGEVERILGNSYGQPILTDKATSPDAFCYKDHMHPAYGLVVTGDSNGKFI